MIFQKLKNIFLSWYYLKMKNTNEYINIRYKKLLRLKK